MVAKIVATNDSMLFSIIYDRYSKKVYNKCFGFSKNVDEAKDLTQDVFLKLFTKLHSFKGKSKFSAWLYSFTYNFCVNYVNRDVGRKMSEASDTFDNHEAHIAEMPDIEEEQLLDLTSDNLRQALQIIAPEDKALLLLKYQDGVSISELQNLLNITESAVKMRLKRAKIKVVEICKTMENEKESI